MATPMDMDMDLDSDNDDCFQWRDSQEEKPPGFEWDFTMADMIDDDEPQQPWEEERQASMMKPPSVIPSEDFHMDGEVVTLENLVQSYPQLFDAIIDTSRNDMGMTPLMASAESRNVEAVRRWVNTDAIFPLGELEKDVVDDGSNVDEKTTPPDEESVRATVAYFRSVGNKPKGESHNRNQAMPRHKFDILPTIPEHVMDANKELSNILTDDRKAVALIWRLNAGEVDTNLFAGMTKELADTFRTYLEMLMDPNVSRCMVRSISKLLRFFKRNGSKYEWSGTNARQLARQLAAFLSERGLYRLFTIAVRDVVTTALKFMTRMNVHDLLGPVFDSGQEVPIDIAMKNAYKNAWSALVEADDRYFLPFLKPNLAAACLKFRRLHILISSMNVASSNSGHLPLRHLMTILTLMKTRGAFAAMAAKQRTPQENVFFRADDADRGGKKLIEMTLNEIRLSRDAKVKKFGYKVIFEGIMNGMGPLLQTKEGHEMILTVYNVNSIDKKRQIAELLFGEFFPRIDDRDVNFDVNAMILWGEVAQNGLASVRLANWTTQRMKYFQSKLHQRGSQGRV